MRKRCLSDRDTISIARPSVTTTYLFLPTLYKEWVFSLQLSFQKESWYKRKHSKKKVDIKKLRKKGEYNPQFFMCSEEKALPKRRKFAII